MTVSTQQLRPITPREDSPDGRNESTQRGKAFILKKDPSTCFTCVLSRKLKSCIFSNGSKVKKKSPERGPAIFLLSVEDYCKK
jgi:hypothetical protein